MRAVWGCTGKVGFSTFSKASRAARNLRRLDEASHVAAYHCTHCNQCHVGENDAHGRRRPKKRPKGQAMTLAAFQALFAADADDQPDGDLNR